MSIIKECVKKGSFQFLGTGGSMGVPVIGCSCAICTSGSKYNNRLRSSALCKIEGKTFLIDCGPDFREQALRAHVNQLDGVILTHAHHDHTAGIDELRIYSLRSGKPVMCLLSNETAVDVRERFHYLFKEDKAHVGLPSRLEFQEFQSERGVTNFQGINIKHYAFKQLGMRVDGLTFGNLAYVTDIHTYPDTIFEDLKGIDTLIISALRYTVSHMHFNVDQAIDFAKRTGAKKIWLMHLSHELDYEKTNAYLPENIRLAYDGLIIDFEITEVKNDE